MANQIRIKRRASGGASGAPGSLLNAELAFNEQDNILYYGWGTGGVGGSATSILPIAGPGTFTTLNTVQSITANKTFTANVNIQGLTTLNDLAVNGGDLTTSASTFNLLLQPQTIVFGTSANNISIGAGTGTTTINNKLVVSGAFEVAGEVEYTGDLAVNGGDITSTQSTFNLLNQPTLINFGTGASNVNIGGVVSTVEISDDLRVIGDFYLGGTASGITASMVGLGNVTNESKATMFAAPTFTGNTNFTGSVTVAGDLTVNGTLTSINSTIVTVDDINIELGSTLSPTDITADGGGITLRGLSDKKITWDLANNNWTSTENWNIASNKVFKINNVSVLSANTLGSSVIYSSLTTLGTVTTGTWSASTIATDRGGTGLTSYTVGDLLYANEGGTLSKLAKGSVGQFLQINSANTAPEWASVFDGGSF